VLESDNKLSYKAVLRLSDGLLIETVFLSPLAGRWSACISSQVGCHLDCRFCATGKGGFKRNLTCEEIIDQVLFWKNFFKERKLEGKFASIVFMGMGEPFDNYLNTVKAVKIINDEKCLNIAARRITISTCGIIPAIKKLKNLNLQINLSISLHAADDKLRSRLMPVNKKYPLKNLLMK